MRLIKMTGGLGNQMFIYAFYLQMKRLHPATRIDLSDMMHYRVHNGYELHRVFPRLVADEFCINQPLKKVLEFLFFKTILERHQPTDTLRPFYGSRLWPLIYFKGFYQSERFFEDVAADVRRAFTFDTALASEPTRTMLATINADPLAVSLHVRRGDYTNPSVWRTTGCVCAEPYYSNAIALVEERLKAQGQAPHFYVFSDDIEWVRQNLKLTDATYVDWNHAADSWQDMLLMSHCRHNVICNSTFSWWGAWLNAHADKLVVCPSRWSAVSDMPHVCPASWTRIPVSLPAE